MDKFQLNSEIDAFKQDDREVYSLPEMSLYTLSDIERQTMSQNVPMPRSDSKEYWRQVEDEWNQYSAELDAENLYSVYSSEQEVRNDDDWDTIIATMPSTEVGSTHASDVSVARKKRKPWNDDEQETIAQLLTTKAPEQAKLPQGNERVWENCEMMERHRRIMKNTKSPKSSNVTRRAQRFNSLPEQKVNANVLDVSKSGRFRSFFNFKTFNKMQSECFDALYYKSGNVVISGNKN
jgi:hypothetical protein